jgi:DMSO/TMAO reductase YedYZ molybdopterin-dependent catalytic subunit
VSTPDAPDAQHPAPDEEPVGSVPPRAGAGEPVEISEDEFRRRTRRAFLVGGGAALAGVLGWRWLRMAEHVGAVPGPIREGLEANEALWRALHRPGALAPTFPASEARMPRYNGGIGLTRTVDAAAWRLRVEGPDRRETAVLTLDDVKNLPRHEMVTELKCVEGWSEVVRWAGARFSDFAARYARATPDFPYVGLRTPNGDYYVGLDRASALHPQTLLCYEMHGAPLTPEHGAPLRLAIPLKYGVKSIKRIGTVRFATERPKDYWAERGYDWYLGH